MEFKQIRTFIEIVDAGSFQKAAIRMGLSQPALSKQISLLERELKNKVFERGARNIQLTPTGEILWKYSKELKEIWTNLFKELKEPEGEIIGEYSISTGGTIAAWILPGIIKKIKKKYPRLKVNVKEGDFLETKELLLNGEVDMGVLTGKIENPGIISKEFLNDKIVPVALKTNSIFNLKKISWKDLKEEELIVYHPSSAIQKLLQKPLQKVLRNHSINIGMELRSVESVIKSVEAGLGIGFISEYSLNNKLKVIPIDNFSVERKFFISHKKNSGKSLRLLINEFLLEANNKN